MERTIKFRAWHETDKVMHYDFQFIKSRDDSNNWIVFTSDKQILDDIPHPFDNPYFEEQFYIMQFTGILDKNGYEIYEGDIIRLGDYNIGIVKFKDGHYYHTAETEVMGMTYWNEVIGNIYQNPELLDEWGK